MATDTSSIVGLGAIFGRVVAPEGRPLAPEVARAILDWEFSPDDLARMKGLSARAHDGRLTDDEDRQMEIYLQAGSLLGILKSRARRALRSAGRED
jgi:hypothetical protein